MAGCFAKAPALSGAMLVLACAVGAGCSREATPAAGTASAVAPAAPAPVPTMDPIFTLARNPGGVHYEGRVGDAATRDRVMHALREAYGSTQATGSLDVDPLVKPARWAGNLAPFLQQVSTPGAMVRFVGDRIELTGAVGDADRTRLHGAATLLFPYATLSGLLQPPAPADPAPPPADDSALLARLNALQIRFEPDSGIVAPDSLDALAQAARLIERSATPLRIEVNPELTDQPDYDLRIARQRAEAVKVQLAIQGINPGRLQTRVPGPADIERAHAGRLRFTTVH